MYVRVTIENSGKHVHYIITIYVYGCYTLIHYFYEACGIVFI